jgi:hypothetical protein
MLRELESQLPVPLPAIPGIHNDFSQRTDIHVLRRGIWGNEGPLVGPRPLSVLIDASEPELSADCRRPRTELARWLTDPQNPLPARVLVNRLWHYHLGSGIVESTNDLGTHGSAPSHRELLDWLAAELVACRWQWKPLHRKIVLSSVYRQSAYSPHADLYSRDDPRNRWLWKFNRRRLSAEELRDAMLAVSGVLNRQAGGPSVMTPVAPELTSLLYKPTQWAVTPAVSQHVRRSIYLIAKRNLRLPFMEVFDSPALQTSCPRRQSSIHAPQALELLNGDLTNGLARDFAARWEQEAGGDDVRRVERAFRLALGRRPTDEERALSLAFVREQPWTEFAVAIFNLNGFLYVQ